MFARNTLKTFAALASGALVTLGTVLPAHAADFTVPAEIPAAAVSVGLVGAAVFSIAVGVKLYKWIKQAL